MGEGGVTRSMCYTIKIDSFQSKSFNVVFGTYLGYFNH